MKKCNKCNNKLHAKGLCRKCYDLGRHKKEKKERENESEGFFYCGICNKKSLTLIKGLCQKCYDFEQLDQPESEVNFTVTEEKWNGRNPCEKREQHGLRSFIKKVINFLFS